MLLVQIRRAGGSVLIEGRANSNTCHILLFSLYIYCYNNFEVTYDDSPIYGCSVEL